MNWIVDPDSEIVVFAKRTVKDLKLPPPFVTQIAQSIQVIHMFFLPLNSLHMLQLHFILLSFFSIYQSQLAEFRSYDGQDMYAGDKIVPIKVSFFYVH
jgi:SWI/SNF-related matrix-associated actin-dependent regulator of chromatin subfamily B protein 1